MARYKYSTDDYTIYVEKIDENSVIYHFEGEGYYTAKLYTNAKGNKYFQASGERLYIDKFEKYENV